MPLISLVSGSRPLKALLFHYWACKRWWSHFSSPLHPLKEIHSYGFKVHPQEASNVVLGTPWSEILTQCTWREVQEVAFLRSPLRFWIPELCINSIPLCAWFRDISMGPRGPCWRHLSSSTCSLFLQGLIKLNIQASPLIPPSHISSIAKPHWVLHFELVYLLFFPLPFP